MNSRFGSPRFCKAATALCASVYMFAGAAFAATWTGANGTDIDDPGNWNGDVTASAMQFQGNANLTLEQDYAVYQVFGTSGDNRSVTIDLSGHALQTTSTASYNRDFWRASNATICITNSSDTAATFTQKSDIQFDSPTYHDATLVVSGRKTTMNGTFFSRGGPRFNFRVLDGATLSGATMVIGSNFTTNTVANGATLSATTCLNIGAGSDLKPNNSYCGAWHGNLLTISGAAASGGTLLVGYGQPSATSGAPYDNHVLVEQGSTASFTDFYVGCGAAATNNSLRAAGAGSSLSATNMKVGTRAGAGSGTLHATLPGTNNVVIVENGATASVKNTYVGAGGNALVIRSGATFEGTAAGTVQLMSDMTDAMIATAGAPVGSRIEIVGGTLHYLNQLFFGESGKTTHAYGHEVFVGPGGTLSEKPIYFFGAGDRLVVSNGTVNVSGLNMGQNGAHDNSLRIMGEDARVNTAAANLVNGVTFEYAIPETPWTTAPFHVAGSFTIPADFSLKLDANSVESFRKRLRDRGVGKATVPLMSASNNVGYPKTITIEDKTALDANMPEGCSLSYADGVLSLTVKCAPRATIFTVH